MKTLLHICCAPCAIYPLRLLREEGDDVTGLFYNPNIHPYSEYVRRRETLQTYADEQGLRLITGRGYPMEDFLRNVAFREEHRCRYCYYDRLRYAAHIARKGKFDRFTSTLLYSKFQDHDLIRDTGEAVGREMGVRFYYRDLREGWKEGVAVSKSRGMYRQQYCGCIYSEKERFYKKSPSPGPSPASRRQEPHS
ncbi:MAG: epoxyqueuosine reductase QueH [Deltaproteobacteria bacterium]|nr:epoxyqueuosine reductase QueH [Deltaproteobacteria bacterium]MBN2686826.1 epoxyqueuosine reductase QueH [Deltaproteobacteria bacterium]